MARFKRILFWFGVACFFGAFGALLLGEPKAAGLLAIAAVVSVVFGGA